MSRVHSRARMADSTAPSIAFAISGTPRCFTIIDALKIAPTGFTRPLPAMSGAVPWTGSNRLRPFVGLMFPEAARKDHRIGFVDHDDLALRSPEGVLDDSCHAQICVDVFLGRDLFFGAPLEPPANAHIQALGVLPHDQQVRAPSILSTQG